MPYHGPFFPSLSRWNLTGKKNMKHHGLAGRFYVLYGSIIIC